MLGRRHCLPTLRSDLARISFSVRMRGDSGNRSPSMMRSNSRSRAAIWGPGHTGFRNGLLYRLLRGHLIISNDPNIKRYYGYVKTIAAQTLALSRLSFVDLPRKVYYISDDAISLGELCSYLVLALRRGRAWSASPSLIRLLGTIGTLNSVCPPRSIRSRLATLRPIPIEPTLSLTGCVTDLTLAAAKTVSWAIRTDERFRSALDSHTTPRLGGPDR